MAWIKLANGGVNQVDDDELRDLILAGAGEEIDGPAPEPAAPAIPQKPYGSQNDPNNVSDKIKEIMDYVSTIEQTGTEDGVARVRAEANKQIEDLHSKYGTGSVEQWVRKQMGGTTDRDSKFKSALGILNATVSPLTRSRVGKIAPKVVRSLVDAVLLPGDSELNPTEGGTYAGASNRTESGLYGDIESAARQAALDRSYGKQADQLTPDEAAAASAQNQPLKDKLGAAASGIVEQVKSNPGQFASDLAGDLLTPSNILSEAITGPGFAMLKQAARATKTGNRVARILGSDPLRDVGAVTGGLGPTVANAAKRTVEETTQGALAEGMQTGDITTEGTAQNVLPAVAGTAVRSALHTNKVPNAAERTPTESVPEEAQPIQQPIAPQPDPEPVAQVEPPVAAPAPLAVVPEVRPIPTRGNTPRDTEATRAAKKIAKKEALQARSEAESQISFHTKKAKEFAKAGMKDDAEKLLDNARSHYDKVWGDLSEFVFSKDKELLAAEAKKVLDKPKRQSKVVPPKSLDEAQTQVDAAVSEGTPEAIEAAKPAIEALNPIGDDAAKIVEDLKAEARAPKIEPPKPETPIVAPEPGKKPKKAPKSKAALEPQEDPTVRPILMGSRQEMHSEEDWIKDPIEYTADTYISMTDPRAGVGKELIAAGRPDLAKELKMAMDNLEKRRFTQVESDNGAITYDDIIAEAESHEDFQGLPLSYLANDPTNVLVDDFADGLGISRQDFVDAVNAMKFTPKEKATVGKVIRELREDKIVEDPAKEAARIAAEADMEARTQAAIAAGERPSRVKEHDAKKAPIVNPGALYTFPMKDPVQALRDVKDLTIKIDDYIGQYAQRISDEFTQMVDEARKRGGGQAAELMDGLQLATRRLDSRADMEISRKMTELNNVIRKIPEVGTGFRSLEDVADALEGKKVDLNEWQQELHDAIRGILDEQGQMYERITGNKMRKDYFPRVEEKGKIRDAAKEFKKQIEKTGIADYLNAGPMTIAKAHKVTALVGGITDPAADLAIRNQSNVLQSLFEKDANGKVSLTKDKDGTPLVNREAAYLLMMPEDGSLPAMMPDLFSKVEKDGKYTVELKPNVDMPDPESFKRLMDSEAMRIFFNREDYDPDVRSSSYLASTGRWQLDGSLANARLMPYLGDEFYDRNPINVMAHIIPRQTRGLMRQELFGVKKEKLQSQMESLLGTFTPQELGMVPTADKKYRLATPKEKAVYDKSLLRSIEDVAMGYMRPFSEATKGQEITEIAGRAARFFVLSGKLLNTAANEIAQAGAAATYGPTVAASYAANRSKVAGLHMESGARKAGESAVRASVLGNKLLDKAGMERTSKLVKSAQKEALDRLVDGDPIVQADIRSMADASTMIGATRYDRALNGLSNLIGSFTQSNKAADIAAHYTGYAMFNDMVARRVDDPKGFARDKGMLEEDLHRTMSEADLDKAAKLLDSQGWPKDADAAEEILRIAGPFISEFKSKLSGRSNPLFQPKIARQRWARGAMWLSMIPFSITSGQIASIRRAARSGNPGESLKRAAKLGIAGAGATYLTMLARQNPAMAAMVGAGATGQFQAAALAQSGAGFEYNPDDEYAQSQMAAMKSDWSRGEGIENLMEKGLLLADMSTRAMWKPRFMQTDILSPAEAQLAGQRTSKRNAAQTIVEATVPGLIAAGQQAGNMISDLGLAQVAAKEGRPGQASSIAFGALAAPSIREGMGKRRQELKQRGLEQMQRDPEAINEKIRPLTEAGGMDLLMSKIRKKVNLNTRD